MLDHTMLGSAVVQRSAAGPPGPPPPSLDDLSPEEINANNSARIVGVVGFFHVLAFVFVVLRVYVRVKLVRAFGIDDALIVVVIVSAANRRFSFFPLFLFFFFFFFLRCNADCTRCWLLEHGYVSFSRSHTASAAMALSSPLPTGRRWSRSTSGRRSSQMASDSGS